MPNSSPTLPEILRSVLRRLEDDSQFAPGDPAVGRFKQRILRSIAQLELQRSSLQAPDVIVPEHTSSQQSPAYTTGQAPTPPVTETPPVSPDSVVVLVARGRRKPGDDGGRSAA